MIFEQRTVAIVFYAQGYFALRTVVFYLCSVKLFDIEG